MFVVFHSQKLEKHYVQNREIFQWVYVQMAVYSLTIKYILEYYLTAAYN